jgi:hypothetical protein
MLDNLSGAEVSRCLDALEGATRQQMMAFFERAGERWYASRDAFHENAETLLGDVPASPCIPAEAMIQAQG